MYFLLTNDILIDSNINIHEPSDLPVSLDFISGKAITIPTNESLIFTTNAKSGDNLRDFMDCSFPLASKRFLTLLQDAGVDNLQIFPAQIVSDEDGTVWNNYFVINVLGLIACADLSKSNYTEIMPGHYRFKELAIDAQKAKDALLFRLQEHSPSIIVHKSVLKSIVDNDPEETLIGWEADDIIQ